MEKAASGLDFEWLLRNYQAMEEVSGPRVLQRTEAK
jgi:hypothetical protein